MKKLYVGNLPLAATAGDLEKLFGQVGAVASANVVIDRDTGRSKGFGFVEMEDADADEAVAQLDGLELDGQILKVAEARPPASRPGGQGGGFGGQRGGRGGQGGSRGGRDRY